MEIYDFILRDTFLGSISLRIDKTSVTRLQKGIVSLPLVKEEVLKVEEFNE